MDITINGVRYTSRVALSIARMECAVEQFPDRAANLRGFLTRIPESRFYRPGPNGKNDRPTDREIIERVELGF